MMPSEPTTTEQTPGEIWRAEQAHLATPEGAQEALERDRAKQDEQIARRLREQWGDDTSGVQRALAAIDLTHERLRMTPELVAQAELFLGREGAAEMARKTGEALATIDPDMTPAEARERIRELQSDRGFFFRLEAGELAARKLWDGLTTIAAFGAR